MTLRLKTAPNVSLGFPEYGAKEGTFIYRNDANAKTVSNLSLVFPEYGMTNSKRLENGLLFDGMTLI